MKSYLITDRLWNNGPLDTDMEKDPNYQIYIAYYAEDSCQKENCHLGS